MTRQRFPLFSITVYFFASLMMLAVPAIARKKNHWDLLGKGMVFPNTLQAKILGCDTIVDILGKPSYKIVIYTDKIKKIPNNIIY
ncbi:MAG: hypothetical protein PHS48_05375 [Bacteroidales bacterium]|nr:hypothetical protein [Bacteroidales bacterium]